MRWLYAINYGYIATYLAMRLFCIQVDAAPPSIDYTQMSIEELVNIQVTSAAKKAQNLLDVSAAMFVITSEDIRRSGANSIPEVLRMVPGLQVARIDASRWAITARGFNLRFANKLLVLIDGRSVYSPLFSGVYWESQDTLLEDVARIEVIRGPGATLWGANAVNGIINIITQSASKTQGALVTLGGGYEPQAVGALRYGTQIGQHLFARVYAKYNRHGGSVDATGSDIGDTWRLQKVGLRMDWQLSPEDLLTVHGGGYQGHADQPINAPILQPPFSQLRDDEVDFYGFNVLGRWQRTLSATSELALQLYFDLSDHDDALAGQRFETLDFDFQHQYRLNAWHDMVWGIGYRLIRDVLHDAHFVRFADPGRHTHLVSAFVQDDIQLIDDRLRLTLGTKLEHNDFTGFEWQPNIRLLWTPHARHAVWVSVARAVRTPTRGEDDADIDLVTLPPNTPGVNPGPLPTFVRFVPNPNMRAETLLAFELGYRLHPIDALSIDVAAFYHDYDDLRTAEVGSPFLETMPTPLHSVLPRPFANLMQGEAYGFELVVDWRPIDRWRWQIAYTYVQLDLQPDPDSRDTATENQEDQAPAHQLSFRSWLDLPWQLEFDVWGRYVAALPGLSIDRYVTLDTRLAWSPYTGLEVSLGAQNLFLRRHAEFVQEIYAVPAEIQRHVYGKITWRF